MRNELLGQSVKQLRSLSSEGQHSARGSQKNQHYSENEVKPAEPIFLFEEYANKNKPNNNDSIVQSQCGKRIEDANLV